MDHADRGFAATAGGRLEDAMASFRQALEFERQAAESGIAEGVGARTRCVLLRSAATLAMDCWKLGQASELVERALASSPPDDIRLELNELKTRIDTAREQAERIQTALTGQHAVSISLRDGGTLRGQVKSTNEHSILLGSGRGEHTIARSRIERVVIEKQTSVG
jgi:sRNA-binding regulator protein Hfq